MQNSSQRNETFGLTLSVFLLIASHLFLRKAHFGASKAALIAGIIVFIIAIAWPKVIGIIQKPWEKIAMSIGEVVTAVILAVVYYLFIAPYVLLLRVCGMRFFRKFPHDAASYWVDKKKTAAPVNASPLYHYERQF